MTKKRPWRPFYQNNRKIFCQTTGNRSNSHHTDLQNCSNNLVITTDGKKLVAVKGLDNFLVVDTEDVLMICPRNEEDVNDLFSDVAMPGLESFR